MQNLIVSKLRDIEAKYDVKIILAVESGSRAWGFASQNSDYDVRFVYVHRPTYYLSIYPSKDTIEVMDKENNLDFSGWDLRKALGLLYKGNPPLLEWLRSPLVYLEAPEAASELRRLSRGYYDVKSAIYHYLHMAYGNWKAYVNERPEVLHKKYLYIFRPLLACKHIEATGEMAPIEISKLLKYLDNSVLNSFNSLLELKSKGVELDYGPAKEDLNKWVLDNIKYYTEYVKTLDHNKKDITVLDKYLFRWAKESWQ